jgi:hypothetical protein
MVGPAAQSIMEESVLIYILGVEFRLEPKAYSYATLSHHFQIFQRCHILCQVHRETTSNFVGVSSSMKSVESCP